MRCLQPQTYSTRQRITAGLGEPAIRSTESDMEQNFCPFHKRQTQNTNTPDLKQPAKIFRSGSECVIKLNPVICEQHESRINHAQSKV
ncbi:hypothetical protein AA103581_1889 [Gluconobacter wancherniae NBRC 103581]|nr:hypothetical protein AA103581_1889 [Gluconobacter wancherniae NBRC 103581]